MLNMVKDDEEVRAYLPEEFFRTVKPDRSFVFNIINTVHPGFLHELIRHASSQRTEVEAGQQNA